MKIQWLGHSSFKLEESTGTTIITDPYNNIGFDMPKVVADAVTLSHTHSEHNN
jgi:L-ascorbate metabolism protein UlaG (beta-lactamase superfamily)